MFNSYSGFKSATKILHDAIKKTPKMGVAQLRETLVAATPYGTTAAYQASFTNNSVPTPNFNTVDMFIVIEKRKERITSTAFDSYDKALSSVKKMLKDAIDNADTLIEYFDHICKKIPAYLDLAFSEYRAMIDDMDEEQLRKVHQWLYQGNAPVLQINQSRLDANVVNSRPMTSKEETLDIFLSFPSCVIAKKMKQLKIADFVAHTDGRLHHTNGALVHDLELHSKLEVFAARHSASELLELLSVPTQYVVEMTDIEYDTDGKEVILPPSKTFLFTHEHVLAEFSDTLGTQRNLFEAVNFMATEALTNYTGWTVNGYNAQILKCEGQTVTRLSDIGAKDIEINVPVNTILKSIREEEWGDVRSYLDEFDTALKANTQAYIQIVQELDKQSHLVVFTRDGDSDWSYEEK